MRQLLIAALPFIAALSVNACAPPGAAPNTTATSAGGASSAGGATATDDVPLPTAPPLTGQLRSAGVLPGVLPRARSLAVPATPATPATPPTATAVVPCEAFTLTAALFDDNSPTLRPDAGAEMTSVAQQLEAQHGVVTIIGYTDSRPTAFPGGNQGLSEARARSVRDALAGRGVDNFADVEGRGDQEPVDLGTTDAAYRRNRRVEVTLQCNTPPTLAPGGGR